MKLYSYILSFLISSLFLFAGQFLCAQISYEEAFPNIDFNFPVEIQNPNDGSNRIFVVEQSGRIKVFPNSPTTTPSDVQIFLDVSSQIAYSPGLEIGLLGLAFHPNYSQNGYFYIYYTDNGPAGLEMKLSRYEISANDINIADNNSEVVIFRFAKNQSESNHNGGKIAFGPDGYLYVSIGDGGGGGDPQGNAQNLNIAFGSILRIDIDIDGNNPIESNPDLPNGNYEIPVDNPRFGASGLDELYAWGIRNTWKFSFDNATSRLWGADVGQEDIEEINLINIGGNYGWNRFEGNTIENSSTSLITTPDIKPIFEYDHNNGDVSITGGYIYRGSSTNPLIQGKYIYGDYVSGRVWSLNYDEGNNTATSEFLFRTTGQFISSFGLDELGEIYFSDYGSAAKIYKIIDGSGGTNNVPVEGIGKWYSLQTSTNGIVESTVNTNNNDYYVGGDFTSAGSLNASNLAIYNPITGWRNFGSGTNGKVNTIAIGINGNVYVGGDFTQIDGITANNIAVWNGSIWSPLGTGTNGPVAKIGIDLNNNVYVGGAFETAGSITVNNIALWVNDSWVALTDISTGLVGTNNEIRAIAFDEINNLYVGGNFDLAGGSSAPRIATWNGTNWGTLGIGTSGFVQAITVTPTHVYAGGNFAIAGTETVNRIARWNRSTQSWEPLGLGLSGNVRAIVQDGPYFYVGGNFETATDVVNTNKIVNNIARWSENLGWEALGSNFSVGVSTQVNSLVFSNDNQNIYIAGNFATAGLTNASNIARWNNFDCGSNAITPEYQLDGSTWESGSIEIQFSEGDNIGLSTQESDTNFTILLPDNSTVSGNYFITNITEANEGVYTFFISNECSATLTIIVNPITGDDDNDGVDNLIDLCPNTPNGETADTNGCSQSQLDDDDNDGVVNFLDQCPNTASLTTVDSVGCPLTIANTNFVISVTDVSCINSTDGTLTIIAEETYNYTAIVTSDSFSGSFEFNSSLSIPNLSPGNYLICLTIMEIPEYEYCSMAIINQPENLIVDSILDPSSEMLSLQLKGGTYYSIKINNQTYQTQETEFIIKLTDEVNNILVSTDKECQGIYEEIIFLNGGVIIHPNPFSGFVILNFDEKNLEVNEVIMYTLEGRILNSTYTNSAYGELILDTSTLASGFYIIKIRTNIAEKKYKIYKK